MKRLMLLVAIGVIGAMASNVAIEADEHNTVPGLTAAGAPLGLHGYDPVAFIDIGDRIEGFATYTAVHDGVAYYFSSESNLERFEKTPRKYTPQFGGFCTFGVSVAKKFDGDPRFAAVENGKLYVFLNEQIFNEFQKDRAGTIAKAERNWREIERKAAVSL